MAGAMWAMGGQQFKPQVCQVSGTGASQVVDYKSFVHLKANLAEMAHTKLEYQPVYVSLR